MSKVLKFAVKNKNPIRRSAFTYCEDELPSHIDLGKSKYGGPFTNKEVEDVKNFLLYGVFTGDLVCLEMDNRTVSFIRPKVLLLAIIVLCMIQSCYQQ